VSPGASPGIMIIDGNYTQGAGGTLLAEIGGTVAGAQYDQLIVTGTVTMDGKIDVALVNGFVPASGNSFMVIQSPAVSGAVASTSSTTAVSLEPEILASGINLVVGVIAAKAQELLNTQINQTNNAPPSPIVVDSTTSNTGSGGLAPVTTYIETTSGQFLPLSATTIIQPGVYTNVETGLTTLITATTKPEPGIYINTENQIVLVITIDETTNQTVAMVGTTGGVDMSGSKSKVTRPAVCK